MDRCKCLSLTRYEVMWLPDPDLVQHISLPLELLGLFLAMLEMFFPRHADQLEVEVDKLAMTWKKPAVAIFGKGSWMRFFAFLLLVIVSTWPWIWYLWGEYNDVMKIYCVLLFLTIILASIKVKFSKQFGFLILMIVIAPLLPIFLLWVIPIVLLRYGINLFDRIGNGRATGGIGIALGVLGLLGEVYQVVVIDLDGGMNSILEYWSVVLSIIIALGITIFFIHRVVKKEANEQVEQRTDS